MRRVVLDDDLTMLIGPASDGALLEVGVLDIEGDDPVRGAARHGRLLRRHAMSPPRESQTPVVKTTTLGSRDDL
jgi:hypothetical protein